MAILKLTLQTARASYRDVKGLLPYYYYMGHVYGVCEVTYIVTIIINKCCPYFLLKGLPVPGCLLLRSKFVNQLWKEQTT